MEFPVYPGSIEAKAALTEVTTHITCHTRHLFNSILLHSERKWRLARIPSHIRHRPGLDPFPAPYSGGRGPRLGIQGKSHMSSDPRIQVALPLSCFCHIHDLLDKSAEEVYSIFCTATVVETRTAMPGVAVHKHFL